MSDPAGKVFAAYEAGTEGVVIIILQCEDFSGDDYEAN